MNWQTIKNLTHVQIGLFLALLIVVVQPNYGLKYGATPVLPAGLLALVGGWLVWKQRAALFVAPAARRLTLVFILLLVPVLLSVPASYDIRYSLGVAGALLVFYFTGLALVRVLRGDAERAWLAKWILIVLAFWIGDSAIQYIFGVDLFGIPITDDARVLGPFRNTLRQPTLIALLLPVALWVLTRKGTLPAFLFLMVAAFIATLGGVRMVIVMLAIVATGFYLRLPRWRFKLPIALLVGAIALLAVGLSPQLKERVVRMSEIRDLSFDTINYPLGYRPVIWENAIHMLIARPLTGVGAGAFAKAYDDHSTRPDDHFRGGVVEKVYHAHQVYFAMAAETGWPGLLGLVIVIGLSLKWYRAASPERRDQAWPFGFCLVVYFFPFNTQPPIYHGNWLFPVILLLFASLLAALDGVPSVKSAKSRNGRDAADPNEDA